MTRGHISLFIHQHGKDKRTHQSNIHNNHMYGSSEEDLFVFQKILNSVKSDLGSATTRPIGAIF